MHTILLAEDDIDDVDFFKDALREIGITHQLLTVGDGAQLMEYLKEPIIVCDILFLDINMPRLSGDQCLTFIRADRRFTDLRVAVLTTADDEGFRMRMFALGANYVVKKTSDFEDFKATLRSVLKTVGMGLK